MTDNANLLDQIERLSALDELTERAWIEMFSALIGQGATVKQSPINARWVIYRADEPNCKDRCWEPTSLNRKEWWYPCYEKVRALINAGLPLNSIDAAVLLLPETRGFLTSRGRTRPDEPLGGAVVSDISGVVEYAQAEAATPALALVIAALKDRATLAQGESV